MPVEVARWLVQRPGMVRCLMASWRMQLAVGGLQKQRVTNGLEVKRAWSLVRHLEMMRQFMDLQRARRT